MLRHPLTWFFVALLTSATFAACSGASSAACGPKSCAGCCDINGICQTGILPVQCGAGGSTCGVCGNGTECVSGVCQVGSGAGGGGGGSSNGGGSANGGGTASGGGGGSVVNCTSIAEFRTNGSLGAAYLAFSSGTGYFNRVFFLDSFAGSTDVIDFEVVYPNSATNPVVPPVTRTLNALTTYHTCDLCAVYYQGCTSLDSCAHTYLARGGTITIDHADRNEGAGHIVGSAAALHFDEWDVVADHAIAGGGCLDVIKVDAFDQAWDADAGSP
jgi:hypothetical protein